MTTNTTDFCFSRSTYVAMLETLSRSGYRFLTLSEESDGLLEDQSRRRCLLRHDVDISLDYAADMARVERAQGVRSTYFLMLRSPMYNLLSRHAAAVMQQLLDFGHEIGLHFDAGCPRRQGMALEEAICFEIDTLSNLVGQRVRTFSFHQPSDEAIRLRVAIPGVINTYHPEQLIGYKYISDSNRIWREMDPFDLATSGFDRVHILIHPIWWMCEDANTFDCWDHAIERNFDSMQGQILETERAYGPRRKIRVVRMRPDDRVPV